jgi:hypothetical protein
MPSLLPYLGDTGAQLHLKISLASPDSSLLEKFSYPFVQIELSDPFSRLIPAQFVTDAGSEIKRVILLLQKDEYPLPEDALWPVTNQTIDECWQKALAFFSKSDQDDSIVILADQIRKDGRLTPWQSLFYCKTMKTFFHPPCPKCGLPLQQCYDDNLLTSLGLQPYSTSLKRYMFCPACFESQGKSDYFTYSGKDFNPSILKDRKDLIKKFGQLNEVRQKTDPFPCMSCSSHKECYGAQGLAVSRIVPFSFYPFFMYILKDRLVNAVDFISLISGRLPEDLEGQLAQKKEVGRINCLKTIRQKGLDKTSFLFDKNERFFLEVLYLKLAFLGELFQIIFPATDSSHHHDFRFSIENIWLKLSDQGGLLPTFWNFKVKYLGLGTNPAEIPFLPKFTSFQHLHFLGTVWFYSLLVNNKQEISKVYEELGRAIERVTTNDNTSFNSSINIELNDVYSPENIFWDPSGKTFNKSWQDFWTRSLGLGWSLLKASFIGDSKWSQAKFWHELESLRKDIKDTLFQHSSKVSAIDTVSQDKAIYAILSKLIEKWSITHDDKKEDEIEETVYLSPTDREQLGQKEAVSQEHGNIQETIILRPGDIPKKTPSPLASKKEEIPETVYIASSKKPSIPFTSSKKQSPKDIGGKNNATKFEPELQATVDLKKSEDESRKADFLEETVIFRQSKPKDKK